MSGSGERKMSEGQRAYEAKRAAKAGMSLDRWLALKEKEATAERVAQARISAAAVGPERRGTKEPAPRRSGFFARLRAWFAGLLERAQRPL